ncbi:MAG TPA: Rieske 2Fe-2S domain-containing protein [Candidatus Binatia bacterium]|nr:Rieske 2Fe-2S domain-containing protein [Candidatus Binatia bacterium]
MNAPAEDNGRGHSRQTPKWRRDFPIEWEGDHYVSRREMVKFLTLGSLLLAIANWATALASRLLHRGSNVERDIGPAAALQAGQPLLFRYPTDEDPCIAVRTPEGRLVAYSQVCTHLSCAVVYDRAQNGFFCPCHHGLFNMAGAPVAGPPTRALPRIRLEERGGRIFAVGKEA